VSDAARRLTGRRASFLALRVQECQLTAAIFVGAMPIYEYRCKKGHTFDHRQSFSDDAIDTCELCGAPASRVFRAPAVHFKGSGFYNTDYGTRKGSREKEAHKESVSAKEKSGSSDSKSSSSSGSNSSSSDSKSSSSDSNSSSDSKPKAKTEG
jgi:putative FmdB family regulatory protein